MDELVKGLEDVVIARYLIAAATTFQAYDYFVSIEDEIRLIWTSKIGIRHAQFFLNRYLPFVTSSLALYYVVLSKDLKGCESGFGALVFTTVIGMLLAELTVFLRVDAVWGHKAVVRVVLGLSYLCSTIVILYFASVHLTKNKGAGERACHTARNCRENFIDEPISFAISLHVGLFICSRRQNDLDSAPCVYSLRVRRPRPLADKGISRMYVKKAADDTTVHFDGTHLSVHLDNSPIMRNLYQDGIVYFSIITISTVANLALLLTASSTLSDAFLVPESILVNVLCSHMHLRIRKSHLRTLQSVNESHGIELRGPIFASLEEGGGCRIEDRVTPYSST